MKSFVIAALCAVLLAACASTPNPIDLQSRGGVFVKDVRTTWSFDDSKQVANTPYQKGKDDMQRRLHDAVVEEFRNSPAGADPVAFQIDIKGYYRVGAAMGNIVGGSNMVIADVTVQRETDGKVLGVYKNVFGMFRSSGGVIGAIAQGMIKPDIVGIMANDFTSHLRRRFDGA